EREQGRPGSFYGDHDRPLLGGGRSQQVPGGRCRGRDPPRILSSIVGRGQARRQPDASGGIRGDTLQRGAPASFLQPRSPHQHPPLPSQMYILIVEIFGTSVVAGLARSRQVIPCPAWTETGGETCARPWKRSTEGR